MTEAQARAIYRKGVATTVQSLTALAAENATLHREIEDLRARLRAATTVSPTTPSGAVPPYQKPNAPAGTTIFAGYAWIADRRQWRPRPWRLVLSPLRLLWLVPITAVPTAMMQTEFGPDTSMGIVPMPHVLLYYALFFFFGALYYDCDDRAGALGAAWRWSLPVTLLLVFPLALEFAHGTFGFRDALLPSRFHRPASVLLQSVFAWGMCLGGIGLFRSLITRKNHTIRYLSDSSYWLYLAHLPLLIAAQAIISPWKGSAYLKMALLSMLTTGFLLLTYHYLVRYTWIGRLLNGPRKRRAPAPAPPDDHFLPRVEVQVESLGEHRCGRVYGCVHMGRCSTAPSLHVPRHHLDHLPAVDHMECLEVVRFGKVV